MSYWVVICYTYWNTIKFDIMFWYHGIMMPYCIDFKYHWTQTSTWPVPSIIHLPCIGRALYQATFSRCRRRVNDCYDSWAIMLRCMYLMSVLNKSQLSLECSGASSQSNSHLFKEKMAIHQLLLTDCLNFGSLRLNTSLLESWIKPNSIFSKKPHFKGLNPYKFTQIYTKT